MSEDVSFSIFTGNSDTCLSNTNSEHSKRAPINATISIDYANALNQLVRSSDGTISPYATSLFEELTTNNSWYIPNGIDFPFPWLPGNKTNPDDETLDEIQAKLDRMGRKDSEDVLRTEASSFVSTILSGVITDALARIAGNGIAYSDAMFLTSDRTSDGVLEGLFTTTGDWAGEMGSLNTTNIEDAAQWLRLDIKFQRYGYGYRWLGNPTAQFGISVLLIHCTVAVIHTFYLLTYFMRNRRGGLPKAWETIPELFVLAVNSGRSNRLKNTSAGIKESSTWGVTVAIRETESQHLEVVVGKDKMEELPRARVEVAYG
jgi:hypothetical protein